MLARSCICLCLISGLAAAADPFYSLHLQLPKGALNDGYQKALENAFKSQLPRALPQVEVATVAPSGACAIPLLQAPIDSSRQFSMRTLPSAKSFDTAIAIPAGPVCGTTK